MYMEAYYLPMVCSLARLVAGFANGSALGGSGLVLLKSSEPKENVAGMRPGRAV